MGFFKAQWRRGDLVQKGEPGTDAHDTGEVSSATRFGVRVRWNGAGTRLTERACDLTSWDGLRAAAPPAQVEEPPPLPPAEPSRMITLPTGLRARVVTLRPTTDRIHEWHREHGGEASLRRSESDDRADPRGRGNVRGERGRSNDR